MTKALKKTDRKDDTIQFRITSDQKRILNEAASVYETSLSEFVMQSAMRMAKSALSESESIKLNDAEWNELMDKIDQPARKHARLAKLFSE